MEKKIKNKKIKESPNNVYYDKKTNTFCQIRDSITNNITNGWLCSCCLYYSDSKTSISEVPFTEKYIEENFEPVIEISNYADFNDIGWKVKDKMRNEQ